MIKATGEQLLAIVSEYGEQIIASKGFQSEKKFIQHSDISVYQHSIDVACLSVYIALNSKHYIDIKSVVRGALLHDYFLYDWHIKDRKHRFHGYTHARTALKNAVRDFDLNPKEKDIILKHMFPLNLFSIPLFKESWIVSLADKICATCETFDIDKFKAPIKAEN